MHLQGPPEPQSAMYTHVPCRNRVQGTRCRDAAAAQRTSARALHGRARSIRARGPRTSHVADAAAAAE